MRESLSNRSCCQYVVEAHELRKSFGATHALNGLNLALREGEVHGFLGPNGAGKTTTIRAILGQLRLSSGCLKVFGRHPRRDARAVHAQLAYVPGDAVLWPSLTGGECIGALGRIQGTQDRGRRDELIERFELDPSRRARSYSKGNRQKVALIAALAAKADLLLLDEPTSGLDPVMADRFIGAIREVNRQGATVLLSSHIMSEVEHLCDRLTIIKQGHTVVEATLAEIRVGGSSLEEVFLSYYREPSCFS